MKLALAHLKEERLLEDLIEDVCRDVAGQSAILEKFARANREDLKQLAARKAGA